MSGGVSFGLRFTAALCGVVAIGGWSVLRPVGDAGPRPDPCPNPVVVAHRLECDAADRMVERRSMDPNDLRRLGTPVDLNRASVAQILSLRGVGPSLSKRIISARPFESVEELVEVRGVGPRVLAANRERLRVSASPP